MVLIVVAMSCLITFQGCMQHFPGRKRKRAIIDAIRSGDLAMVQQIVSSGLPLNFDYWSHISWSSIGSPVSVAFRKQDPSIANFLLANGASLSPKSPGNGRLLLNAIYSGDTNRVDLALKAGHNIHFQPPHSAKPLAAAIHNQNISMARFLVSKGANKDDVAAGACRWHAMRAETILFVHELGFAVPTDVMDAVRNDKWYTPPKSQTGFLGHGGS